MLRSAVPPPETSNPCWWGDHARAFTAALCWRKVWTGWLLWVFQIITRLSLPPEASCCRSKDQRRPQTSCLWPLSLLEYWLFYLRSRCKMLLSLEPVLKNTGLFQAIDATLPMCPTIVRTFASFSASHSCTSPVLVPTARMLFLGHQDVAVTRSLNPSSHSLLTLEVKAFHK